MAWLTVTYHDFSYGAIVSDLRAVFDQQYQLSFTPEVEIRTRTVVYADPLTGESTDVEEQYEWHILNITLAARSFTEVISPLLDTQQAQHFSLLQATKGSRQIIQGPFSWNWLSYVSSPYGYRIHPISGEKSYHTGVDIAVAQGTAISAATDGVVTTAQASGGYGLLVEIRSEGAGGAVIITRYAHCSELLVAAGQSVAAGDVIAKVGSTGDSTGPHLHFEVLKDGRYINPLYFAQTNDDGTGPIPPGSPGGISIPAYPGEPMDDERFAAMMTEAQRHLGKPYVFGASGPDSFDCSGFVCYVINHSGVGNVGRIGAQGLFNLSVPVSRTNARPGDLIFFTGTYDAGMPVTHIGIYIGNGQMIHAGSPVQYTSIDTPYWTQHFYAFGRI
jgi:murein DD-endopeptidase MepM/ murein hydrolase activator NlpD